MKIIKKSQKEDAKSEMKTFLEGFGDEKIENLIVVVLTDGFCYEDGEVILFEDGPVLLDSFLHDTLAVEPKRRKCELSLYDSLKLTFLSSLFYPDKLPPKVSLFIFRYFEIF